MTSQSVKLAEVPAAAFLLPAPISAVVGLPLLRVWTVFLRVLLVVGRVAWVVPFEGSLEVELGHLRIR